MSMMQGDVSRVPQQWRRKRRKRGQRTLPPPLVQLEAELAFNEAIRSYQTKGKADFRATVNFLKRLATAYGKKEAVVQLHQGGLLGRELQQCWQDHGGPATGMQLVFRMPQSMVTRH